MLRFAVFALLVTVASASYYPFGPVEGIVPCGSKGKILEVRVTDCTTLPCLIIKGSKYDIEVDFEPFEEHNELLVLVTVIRDNEDYDIVHETVPAVVAPGRGYTLTYPWTVIGAFDGLVALRIQLKGTNGPDATVELCGLATADVRDSIIF